MCNFSVVTRHTTLVVPVNDSRKVLIIGIYPVSIPLINRDRAKVINFYSESTQTLNGFQYVGETVLSPNEVQRAVLHPVSAKVCRGRSRESRGVGEGL